jgi:hypothetical protein
MRQIMDSIPSSSDDTNLSLPYNAIVDYHNNLVQVRFTIAGLYLAATGFLVNSWFNNIDHQKYGFLPILGISLALVCWLLEIRTCQLLDNLWKRGSAIENKMKVNSDIGFFALMKKQSIQGKWPFIKRELPSRKFFKYIVSHTFGFNLIYLIIFIFWIIAFITR